MRHTLIIPLAFAVAACGGDQGDATLQPLPPGAQAVSSFGDTLYPPPQTDEVRLGNEQRLAAAREEYEADPGDADALIWFGRRTAYLGQYREAIGIYGLGIDVHPDDARLYRHRGHRYISVRRFDLAVTDLRRAAELIRGTDDEVEPDGIPNARNTPTSTLQFNIWYHLGLAHYVQGQFEDALQAYRECLQVSDNPDAQVATSYWLYMTLRRLGHDTEAGAILASIASDMDIIENRSYHQLLLLNKGELSQEALLDTGAADDEPLANATVGYGIGMWHALEGRDGQAEETWQSVLAGSQWAAFGFIAAEAEMAMRVR